MVNRWGGDGEGVVSVGGGERENGLGWGVWVRERGGRVGLVDGYCDRGRRSVTTAEVVSGGGGG